MWGRKKKGDPEGAFTALADHGVGGSGDVSPPVQPSALSMLPPVDHARARRRSRSWCAAGCTRTC